MSNKYLQIKEISHDSLKLISGGSDGEKALEVGGTPVNGTFFISTEVPVSPNASMGPTVYVDPQTNKINGGGIVFSFTFS